MVVDAVMHIRAKIRKCRLQLMPHLRYIQNHASHCAEHIFNNYSPKAKLILLNNPRDEVEGIIQQY